MERTYIEAVRRCIKRIGVGVSQKYNFGELSNNCDFWTYNSVIIDGSLYGRVLGYFSMVFVSFRTWNDHILKLCVGILFLKNLNNCNFGEFSKSGDLGS